MSVDRPQSELIREGELFGWDGNRLGGVALRLIAVNDSGEELSQLAVAVTDSAGAFDLGIDADPNASLLVVAELPDAPLRGFYAGRTASIPVHPLTDALVTLVLDITGPTGGRSLLDFETRELRDIGDALFDVDASGLDLRDAGAVEELVRSRLGREIALAAGGGVTARPSSALEGAEGGGTAHFIADTDICPIGAPIFLLESQRFRFDIEEDGTLCGGSSASLDAIFNEGALQLVTPGNVYYQYGGDAFPADGTSTAELEGEREIVLGPYPLRRAATGESDPPAPDSMSVARKIRVVPAGDYVRYLEILTNSDAVDRTLARFEVRAFLATGNESALLTFDRVDETADPGDEDRFVVAYDAFGARPTVGIAYQDGLGTMSVDGTVAPGTAGGEVNEIRFGWSQVTVPAGQSLTFLHYTLLSASRFAPALHDALVDLVEHPDMDGMSVAELAQLANFAPAQGTVTGEAGAVIGGAKVSARNERTGVTMTGAARRDGSFDIPLDAAVGDSIHLQASDGLDASLLVE